MPDINLLHRCRLARDYLFSAKNENNTSCLLSGSGMDEGAALNVWKKVSDRIMQYDYELQEDFLKDISPMKGILLNCTTTPTKKRTKHVDEIFRTVKRILKPSNFASQFSPYPGLYDQVVDVMSSENAANIIQTFHTTGRIHADEIRIKTKTSIAEETLNDQITSGTNKIFGKSNQRHRVIEASDATSNSALGTLIAHNEYHGVLMRTGNCDQEGKYIPAITMTSGRGRSSSTSTVLLRNNGFANAAEAARAHDLASIRTRGPELCKQFPVSSGNNGLDSEDDSFHLNFDISRYAEEEMSSFTQWDSILLKGFSGMKQWPGLMNCDFSFLLFCRDIDFKKEKSSKLESSSPIIKAGEEQLPGMTDNMECNLMVESDRQDQHSSSECIDRQDQHTSSGCVEDKNFHNVLKRERPIEVNVDESRCIKTSKTQE